MLSCGAASGTPEAAELRADGNGRRGLALQERRRALLSGLLSLHRWSAEVSKCRALLGTAFAGGRGERGGRFAAGLRKRSGAECSA